MQRIMVRESSKVTDSVEYMIICVATNESYAFNVPEANAPKLPSYVHLFLAEMSFLLGNLIRATVGTETDAVAWIIFRGACERVSTISKDHEISDTNLELHQQVVQASCAWSPGLEGW